MPFFIMVLMGQSVKNMCVLLWGFQVKEAELQKHSQLPSDYYI